MLAKLQELENKYLDLEQELSDPDLLKNQKKYQEIAKRHADLRVIVQSHRQDRGILEQIDENKVLLGDPDPEIRELAQSEIKELEGKSRKLGEQIKRLLLPKDPNDEKNVLLEVRAGTGGDEAALFAADLFRMYSRYAEHKKWKVEVLNAHLTGGGGFKEIVALISGNRVYSCLKYESGTHRVQRVPDTETQGRIHTSAVTVAVLPEADDVDVDIDSTDLRIDVYRASGAGGQHVNKTESAVRITHLPTGLVVQCQDERSQHKNKDHAMKQLRAKLYELELSKRNAESQLMEDSKSDIGWGSQIRSYVLDQSRIKDLRTNVETGNTQAVLDGDLDQFVEASLKQGLSDE
jgi:peptide chain release factor 1